MSWIANPIDAIHYEIPEEQSPLGFEKLDAKIKVFPHPVKDWLNLNVCGTIDYQMIGLTPAEVSQESFVRRLDVYGLRSGIYLLK